MFAEEARTTGCLIAVVGLDGAGKSTQVSLLGDWLRSLGIPAHAFSSISMAPVRSALNRIADEDGLRDYRELIGQDTMRLVSACAKLARLAPYEDLVRHGNVVVVDRYTYCQYALSVAQGGGSPQFLRRLFEGLPTPDLTIYLEVHPEEAQQRINARGIDVETLEFLHDFRAAYRELPEFSDFVSVDGRGDMWSVQSAMRETIVSAMPDVFRDVNAYKAADLSSAE